MNPVEIVDAIKFLNPAAQFTFAGIDLDSLEWHSETNRPTNEEIIAAIEPAKAAKQIEAQNKVAARSAILERLGLTAEDVAILIG
jgi:hypothetical protein